MKKYIDCFLVSAIFVIAPFAGCKKNSTPSRPDTGNFSATAYSGYVPGTSGTIFVSSTTLASGPYTVKYSYYGYGITFNPITGQSATLAFNNHTGSFQTQILTDSAVTYVTLDSIINSSGLAVALTSNNFVSLSDSNGLMEATMSNGTTFRATNIASYLSTSGLVIYGTDYLPGTINNNLLVFTTNDTPGTYRISNTLFTSQADYVMNTSSFVTDTALYGVLTINTVAPLLTGTFTITYTDSVKMTGSFTCPAP
jgi:hypothetical protein